MHDDKKIRDALVEDVVTTLVHDNLLENKNNFGLPNSIYISIEFLVPCWFP